MGQIIIIGLVMLILWYAAKNNKTSSDNPDETIFVSTFTRGGSFVVPEKLIFDKNKVTWKKNHGIDYLYANTTSRSIPFKNIVGINIHKRIIGCDVEIVGKGFQSIYASNFTNEDVVKIENLINNIVQTH